MCSAGVIALAKVYALIGTFQGNLSKTYPVVFKTTVPTILADSSIQLVVLSIAESAVTSTHFGVIAKDQPTLSYKRQFLTHEVL